MSYYRSSSSDSGLTLIMTVILTIGVLIIASVWADHSCAEMGKAIHKPTSYSFTTKCLVEVKDAKGAPQWVPMDRWRVVEPD